MSLQKSIEEIELIRESALLVSKTLGLLAKEIKEGVTTLMLDKIAEEFIRDNNAIPGFLGLYDFPNTLCTSPNSQVVHGIPNDEPLKNGDMVGHTGSFEAAVKACETIDKCVKKVITSCIKSDYTVLLISDHGNCDMMLNEDGSPNTAHTKNLVPLILINSEYKSISDGILADIAPTILKIMNIEIPSEMTQNPLV